MLNNKMREKIAIWILKRRLRTLPQIKPPEGLEEKLATIIPAGSDLTKLQYPTDRQGRGIRFVATAAAVLIVGFMLLINYGLSNSSAVSLAGFDEQSLGCVRFDMNNIFYDQNEETMKMPLR